MEAHRAPVRNLHLSWQENTLLFLVCNRVALRLLRKEKMQQSSSLNSKQLLPSLSPVFQLCLILIVFPLEAQCRIH